MSAAQVLVPGWASSKAAFVENVLELSAPKAPSKTSLLDQLTLQEKVSLLSGSDFASATGVERLKIPVLKVSVKNLPLDINPSGQC